MCVGFEGKDIGLKYMMFFFDFIVLKLIRVLVDEVGDVEGEYFIFCCWFFNVSLYVVGLYCVGCNNVGVFWREGSKIGLSL